MSGREIESEILELGIGQAEFAREAGISVNTLCSFFEGKRVRPTTLSRIKRAMEFFRAKAKPVAVAG